MGMYEQPEIRTALFETTVRLVLAHIDRTDDERALCVVILNRLALMVQVRSLLSLTSGELTTWSAI